MAGCCALCNINETSSALWICDCCNKTSCQKCAKLTASEVKCMELKKGRTLCFLCDHCQEMMSVFNPERFSNKFEQLKDHIIQEIQKNNYPLQKSIENQSELVKNLSEELSTLNGKIEKLDKSKEDIIEKLTPKLDDIQHKMAAVENPRKDNVQTYADITAKKNSIIVKPKDTAQSVMMTKTELLQNVNPINEKICIDNLKTISKGGMVINCPTKEDADKLKTLVSERLADKYEVNVGINMHPRIRIARITEKHEAKNLLDLITKQNNDILLGEEIKLISYTPIRNKVNLYQCVLQVSVAAYKRLLEIGYVFIGYDLCQVFDGLDIRQCYKCCGYHHLARNCTNNTVCPRCAENHEVKNCKSEILKCHNCTNLKSIPNLDVSHAAWDNRCHIYKQKMEEFKGQILK